jgi:hypothetical protein
MPDESLARAVTGSKALRHTAPASLPVSGATRSSTVTRAPWNCAPALCLFDASVGSLVKHSAALTPTHCMPHEKTGWSTFANAMAPDAVEQ